MMFVIYCLSQIKGNCNRLELGYPNRVWKSIIKFIVCMCMWFDFATSQ